jgi:type IV pilus assembly protein PilF
VPQRLLPVLMLALAMTGCATLSSDVDDLPTGDLGSPTAEQSPADVYIELSKAYLQDGQLTEAYKNARKAVLADSRSSNAHYMHALVEQRLGQFEAADKAYRQAIARDPRNSDVLNAYGGFLCAQMQRFDAADPYFRRALENPLYGTPWFAYHNAGDCKYLKGDIAGAETDFRAALQRNPRFAPSLLRMAEVSFENRQYLSARAYLQRYEEVAPHTPKSLWLGVQTERQLGDNRQTASYGRQLRAEFPDSEQARYLETVE